MKRWVRLRTLFLCRCNVGNLTGNRVRWQHKLLWNPFLSISIDKLWRAVVTTCMLTPRALPEFSG